MYITVTIVNHETIIGHIGHMGHSVFLVDTV